MFENVFKMLTGRKFEISFLLGFPLSSGTIRAVFTKKIFFYA